MGKLKISQVSVQLRFRCCILFARVRTAIAEQGELSLARNVECYV